jgi:glutamine synthetase
MEKYNELKELIESMEADVNKTYNKRNKSASIRVRKDLQRVKQLAQEMRLDISNYRKEWE